MIDIGASLFESGQAYVALSRFRRLDALYLASFCLAKLTCNLKAFNQMNTLRKKAGKAIEFASCNELPERFRSLGRLA